MNRRRPETRIYFLRIHLLPSWTGTPFSEVIAPGQLPQGELPDTERSEKVATVMAIEFGFVRTLVSRPYSCCGERLRVAWWFDVGVRL